MASLFYKHRFTVALRYARQLVWQSHEVHLIFSLVIGIKPQRPDVEAIWPTRAECWILWVPDVCSFYCLPCEYVRLPIFPPDGSTFMSPIAVRKGREKGDMSKWQRCYCWVSASRARPLYMT